MDPDWQGDGRSVSGANEQLRQLLTMYYDAVFPDPELRAKVLPNYPPIAKRVVLDNGRFPQTLQRDNVHLELLYTVKNLDDTPGTFNVMVDGANQYIKYDEDVVAAALAQGKDKAEYLPLME